MKVALLVQRYEKEMDSAQNEMITFFAADDQDPCKDCGRKHPEESGCTRRKLLEGTLQKFGPLAAQVKKIREVQHRILDGKPPSTVQTKAMEEAARSLEGILHTTKNPPKPAYKGKSKVAQSKGTKGCLLAETYQPLLPAYVALSMFLKRATTRNIPSVS